MPSASLLASVGDRLLASLLDTSPRPALVLHEPGLVLAPVDEESVVVRAWDEVLPEIEPKTAVLVAHDVAGLRRGASFVAQVPRARVFGCVVEVADAVVPVRAAPLWPPVIDVDARLLEGGAVTRCALARRAPGHEVLAVLAGAGLHGPRGAAGVRVAAIGPGAASLAPPMDPTVAVGYAADDERPPDVLLLDPPRRSGDPEVSSVTGRAPAVIPTAEAGWAPIDTAVRLPAHPPTASTAAARPLPTGATLDRLHPALVAELADASAVHVDWASADPRTVVGLAMAGLPLVAPPAPEPVRSLLGEALAEALTLPLEPRSVRAAALTRAALTAHGAPAWRARWGLRADVRAAAYPSVAAVVPPAWRTRWADQRLDLPGATLHLVADAEAGDATGADTLLLVPDGPGDPGDPGDPHLVTDLLLARARVGGGLVATAVATAVVTSDDTAVLLDRVRWRELGRPSSVAALLASVGRCGDVVHRIASQERT